MKKNVLSAIIAASLVVSVMVSCGKKERERTASSAKVTVERTVGDFEKISIEGSMDVYYTQGDTTSVSIYGKEKFVNRIKTKVEGNTLVLYVERHRGGFLLNRGADKVKVYITSPDLIAVKIKGSGDFKAGKLIDTDTLNISVYGSGDIDMKDVICDAMTIDIYGSGDIEVGRLCANSLYTQIKGSGDVAVHAKNVADTKFIIQGSGDITGHFDNGGNVDCVLEGAGDVTLSGDINQLTQSVKGVSDINTANLRVRRDGKK